MSLSTHLLDLTAGQPAAGVTVTLVRLAGPATVEPVAEATTSTDGRIAALAAATPAGRYRMIVDSGAYFARQGLTPFFPEVVVSLDIRDPAAHYHVPVLLTPFGHSTYRGS